jgi:hypothetical protein
MTRTVKWLGRILYAAAIVGALAFGVQQAWAGWHVNDPCVCPVPFEWGCVACCGPDGGMCTSQYYCICA